MPILSFETATYFGGVGYVGPGGEGSAGPFEPRAASREVLAAADALLAAHGCRREDIDLVVVSTGPGLFTGVRVGMAIAKTLVWSQGPKGHAALVGVPTLEAVASLALGREDAKPATGDWIAAITDARRGEVYAALFEVVRAGKNGDEGPAHRARPELRSLGPDVVVRPDRLASRLIPKSAATGRAKDAGLWLVGDATVRYEAEVREQFGPEARIVPLDSGNLPVALARLGGARYARGNAVAPEALHPHYVRRPDARPPVLPAIAQTQR